MQSVFSDYCGYLVATEESLAFVNDHLKSPVPMKRFRPSIVISGSPSFDEVSKMYLNLITIKTEKLLQF